MWRRVISNAYSTARITLLATPYAVACTGWWRPEQPELMAELENMVAFLDLRSRNLSSRGLTMRIEWPPELLRILEESNEKSPPLEHPNDLQCAPLSLIRCGGGTKELLQNYAMRRKLGEGKFAKVGLA